MMDNKWDRDRQTVTVDVLGGISMAIERRILRRLKRHPLTLGIAVVVIGIVVGYVIVRVIG